MKNKYSPIIKIKKQALEKAELMLAKAKAKLNEKKALCTSKKESYYAFSIQKSGTIESMRADLELKNIARNDLLKAKEERVIAAKELAHFEHQYKKAFMDFEKMKYLELEEIKKYQKLLKEKEAKFLDEIAISRYFKEKDEA